MRKGIIFLFLISAFLGYGQKLEEVSQAYNLVLKENNYRLDNNIVFFQNNTVYIATYSTHRVYTVGNTKLNELYFKQKKLFSDLFVQGESIFCKEGTGKVLLKKRDTSFWISNKKPESILQLNTQKILFTFGDSIFVHQNNADTLTFFKKWKIPSSYSLVENISNHKKYLVSPLDNDSLLISKINYATNLYIEDSTILKKPKKINKFLDIRPNKFIYLAKNSKIYKKEKNKPAFLFKKQYCESNFYNWFLYNEKGVNTIENIFNEKEKYVLPNLVKIIRFVVDSTHQSAYFSTVNKPFKTFFYLSKIPKVFEGKYSSSCFTLTSNASGNILVGSYNRSLSVIRKDSIRYLPNNHMIMPGSIAIGNDFYIIIENNRESSGIFKVDSSLNITPVKGSDENGTTGFYLFNSSDNYLYYGTSVKGLWRISQKDLTLNTGNWQKINIKPFNKKGKENVFTITEDKQGRIWFGSNLGIGIYNPKTTNVKYAFHNTKNTFKSFCSTKDKKGNLWLGGKGGLYYYNNNNADSIKKIKHPFIENHKIITSMLVVENYLILLATDKVLVLNLDEFYKNNTVTINYLSQQETNFKGSTEQNCLTIDNDHFVWFATSHMIYKWDFKKWLRIPKEKIYPKVLIKIDSTQTKTILPNKKCTLSPLENNFEIILDYHNKDNLPRYFKTSFYKKGKKPLSKIATTTSFKYSDISAGSYFFDVEILQIDGSVSKKRYLLFVQDFWYKKWWVWTLIIGVLFISLGYFYKTIQDKKVAEQKLIASKLYYEKQQQEILNKMASYQLIALSNQFRPHFLLNTINTIGAYLKNQPIATKILDLLGKSVGSLFLMAKENRNYHPFKEEWNLVLNLIEIYKTVYIPELEIKFPSPKILQKIYTVNIPYGLLQINIENALLHGLHNKINPPYNLNINISEKEFYYIISISDDGIGRKKAKTLTNKRKHGTGLKNLNQTINLYNEGQEYKITIVFHDKIFKTHGTKVVIKLPKKFNYEIYNKI